MTIKDINKRYCSGCSLCVQLCTKKCISMHPDREGFFYPVIDEDSCVDCGLCYQKCPVNSQYMENHILPIYYSATIADKQELLESSSGGIFIALAKYILSEGGYVCGCVFDEDMSVRHICTNSLDEVRKMKGSKYVQSTVGSVLPQIKELIAKGYKILFTGTACQIAAVKGFIKSTNNLFLVDILCHGVPSPLFFRKYVEFLENKHGGRVVNVEFRNKKKLGWGSEHRTYYEIEKNGKLKGYRPILPVYFCSFFWGANLRECCYNCLFAGEKRISDITIGDFWGYWSYYHKKFPEGISVISVNTNKGKILFEAIKNEMIFCDELSADKAKGSNTNFYHPTPRPIIRDYFYIDLYRKSYKDFIWFVYLNRSIRKKVIISLYGRFVPQFVKNLISRIRFSYENICNNSNV